MSTINQDALPDEKSVEAPTPHKSTAMPLCDGAANFITCAIEDIDDLQQELTPSAGNLWLHVDLIRAVRHLRAASRLVESVADRIDAPAVTR